MGTFIAPLMKRIPNKHTRLSPRGEFGLFMAKAMNIGCSCTPKPFEGNLRSEAGRGDINGTKCFILYHIESNKKEYDTELRENLRTGRKIYFLVLTKGTIGENK